MRQPPASGPGPGPQPGRHPGVPGVPGGAGGGATGAARPVRELRLGDFAQGGAGDACPPGASLAVVLDLLSGADRRCARASDDELAGILGRWAALESWAASAKLGVTAELIRRRARPGHENRADGAMPGAWEEGLGHELSLALALSVPGADKLAGLAWALQARLPGTAALLAAGIIDALKAGIIAQELAVLDDELAARAEALILDELASKAPGQVGRLAAAAVVAVDPRGAEKRRERAEKEDARVRFWRERAGTSALAAYGLPTDAALAANANISRRARQYKRARLDGGMDQLRVLAYLDILNGISADARIAGARAQAQAASQGSAGHGSTGDGPAGYDSQDLADDVLTGDGTASRDGTGDDLVDDAAWQDACWDLRDADADGAGDGGCGDDRDDSGPGGGPGRGGGPDGGPGPDAGSDAGPDGDAGPALAASTNLTIPLADLIQLAGLSGLTGPAARPGHAHGLGPLDPGLARDLAAAAARSPHSTWCLTITGPDGYAIGHGCARPAKGKRGKRGKSPPPGTREWAFTRRDRPGPPGGWGAWTLALPDGRQFDVQLGPVPVTGCDHRHESRGYQPSGMLRHLVQIRDGECTFPCCSRHARDSDFEHALPYEKGGRTCACNAGARSRRCHRVKQSKGWKVTQPRPGWHQWTAPSGRTYTQEPRKYPA